jgi:hypothetical protein
MTNETVISTEAGVVRVDQPAGTVTVIETDNSTCVEMEVDDGEGNKVRVYLGYQATTALMVSLGAAAAKF